MKVSASLSLFGSSWIEVEATQGVINTPLEIQHLDRGEQSVETPGQNRLSSAAATSDHHTPKAGVDGLCSCLAEGSGNGGP